jgi:hypothetical protein
MTHLVVRNSDGECARTPPTPPMQVRVHAPPLPANARAYASAMRVHREHFSVAGIMDRLRSDHVFVV